MMRMSCPLVRPLTTLILASRLSSAQATVSGTVFDSLRTSAPLKGATVVVPELSRYATTDSRGRFRLDSIPPGQFSITFLHPALDSLDIAAQVQLIVVPERGTVEAHLTTPSPAAAYARLCPGTRDVTTGLLLGRVRDVDDARPIASAVVTADWMEYGLDRTGMRGRVVRANAVTDSAGVYLMCGVPSDVMYRVFALATGYAAGPVPVVPDARLLDRLDLAISRHDSAARLSVAELVDTTRRGAPLGAAPGNAALSGRVLATSGRPIPVALVGMIGADLSTRADSSGHFRLSRIPAGTRAITVRSIGLAPTTLVFTLRAGETADTTIRIENTIQALREVTVLATRAKPVDNTGFDERIRVGLGNFITETEIEKRPATDLYGFLARVPGLIYNITVANDQMIRRVLMHGGSGLGSSFCTPTFFLDGQKFELDSGPQPLETLVQMAQTAWLKGIEVYSRTGSIPQRFDYSGSTGCGSVVIWTK
jgi:hypothetical protein